MKKSIIKWSLIVVVVLITICTIQFLRGRWISPCLIQKTEFKGYDSCSGPTSDTVELSRDEIREIMRIYNSPVRQSKVHGKGCTSYYSFTVYLVGGLRFHVREAGSPRIEVSPILDIEYWIYSEALTEYAETLIEKYNLMSTPSC